MLIHCNKKWKGGGGVLLIYYNKHLMKDKSILIQIVINCIHSCKLPWILIVFISTFYTDLFSVYLFIRMYNLFHTDILILIMSIKFKYIIWIKDILGHADYRCSYKKVHVNKEIHVHLHIIEKYL